MAEGHKEIQGREDTPSNVRNIEAEREYRLLRKSRGYKEPPKHIKIITAFLNRQTIETPAIDGAPARLVPTQTERASIDTRAQQLLEPKNNEIALASIRRKLREAQKGQPGDSQKWREIAKAHGWATNPDYPDDGIYVDRIVERAQKLGLDPLALTPQERKELTTHGSFIIERAEEQGLDPLTLTPEERHDLARMGRILTPQERREHAEIEEKYRVHPLTPEEREYWLLQYRGKRRYDVPPTPGEVIQRILEMIGKGIKLIPPPEPDKWTRR